MSALRSLAVRCCSSSSSRRSTRSLVLLLFWLPPRAALPVHHAAGAGSNLCGRALDLRHPLARRSARENMPSDAAHRDVQAQLDVGDAGAQPVLPAARVRRQEGAAVDPVLRLGLRAGVADHHRPQGRARRDGRRSPTQGRERFAQGFWIVVYPEGTRIRAGTRARYKTGGARLAHRRSTCRSCRSRTTPATCGRRACFGKRPGTVTMSIGKPIAPAARTAAELTRKSRRGSRAKSQRLGSPLRDAPDSR